MPLNATSYLEEHGWEGKGVALDGRQGRGLKKPLALPMKRNLRGLGKDRDRATEWWDCLFETSAKSINIQVGQGQNGATNKAIDAAAALKKLKGKDKASTEEVGESKQKKGSLVSQAKREYARKMLMSGFVRAGKETLLANNAEKDLERILLEQQEMKKEAFVKLPIKEAKIDAIPVLPNKEERKRLKEDKKRRKEAKRLKKEASASKPTEKRKRQESDEIDRKKKRKGSGKEKKGP